MKQNSNCVNTENNNVGVAKHVFGVWQCTSLLSCAGTTQRVRTAAFWANCSWKKDVESRASPVLQRLLTYSLFSLVGKLQQAPYWCSQQEGTQPAAAWMLVVLLHPYGACDWSPVDLGVRQVPLSQAMLAPDFRRLSGNALHHPLCSWFAKVLALGPTWKEPFFFTSRLNPCGYNGRLFSDTCGKTCVRVNEQYWLLMQRTSQGCMDGLALLVANAQPCRPIILPLNPEGDAPSLQGKAARMRAKYRETRIRMVTDQTPKGGDDLVQVLDSSIESLAGVLPYGSK